MPTASSCRRASVTWPPCVCPDSTSGTPWRQRPSASSAMCDIPIDGRSRRRPLTASSRRAWPVYASSSPTTCSRSWRKRDRRVAIAQDLDAAALERVLDLVRARPVVVIAQHRDHRRLEPAHELGEIVEIELAVADEVAGEQHQIRLLRVGHLDGGALHLHRRDTADVLIGQVRDAQMRRSARDTRPDPRSAGARCDEAATPGSALGSPLSLRLPLFSRQRRPRRRRSVEHDARR